MVKLELPCRNLAGTAKIRTLDCSAEVVRGNATGKEGKITEEHEESASTPV